MDGGFILVKGFVYVCFSLPSYANGTILFFTPSKRASIYRDLPMHQGLSTLPRVLPYTRGE